MGGVLHISWSCYEGLKARIDKLEEEIPSSSLKSPLTGTEIMNIFDLKQSKLIGFLVNYLTEARISSILKSDNKEDAVTFLYATLGLKQD